MVKTYEGYVEVEGGRVWYRVAGTGSGTPMLCVHGGPGVPHDVLLPLIEQVGPDRPVVFYDQLGCGRSAGPTDPDLFSLENLFAEVAAVRDAVGLTDYHLYGQSAGTAIASGFAKHNMRGIKSLVLSSAVLDEEHWRPYVEEQVENLPDDVRAAIADAEEQGTIWTEDYEKAALEYTRRHICRVFPFPEVIDKMWEGVGPSLEVMYGGKILTDDSAKLRHFSVLDGLGAIDVPVLFMNGRHDLCAPEVAEFYAGLLPDARPEVFEDSSHYPHIEEPEQHERVINSFLREVDLATSRLS